MGFNLQFFDLLKVEEKKISVDRTGHLTITLLSLAFILFYIGFMAHLLSTELQFFI